jgi:hypothetical protein
MRETVIEFQNATEEAAKLAASINSIPAYKSYTSRGNISERPNYGSIYDTGIDAGGASGLSMVVPAGYPNDSFKIGASTGEPVAIGKNAVNSGSQEMLQEIQGMRRELNRLPLALRDAYLFAVKNA